MRTQSVWAVINNEESVGGEYLVHSLWYTMSDAKEQLDELDNLDYTLVELDIN